MSVSGLYGWEVELEVETSVALTKQVLKAEEELLNDDDPIIKRPPLLRMQNSMGNTPLHVAVIHGNFIFAEAFFKMDPNNNNWVKNLDGNTPLHIAAATSASNHFVRIVCDDHYTTTTTTTDTNTIISPLRIRDAVGNTALHVAAIHGHIDIATTLLRADPTLASVVNDSGKSPLHLTIKHFPLHNQQHIMDDRVKQICMRVMDGETTQGDYDLRRVVISFVEMIVLLVKEASYVAGWRDKTGLTPLHKAASSISKSLNLNIIGFMIKCCPQSMEVCDTSGKTILHHLINRTQSEDDIMGFFHSIIGVGRFLINLQDDEGNTVMHLTVIHKDFIMLRLLDTHDFIQASEMIRNKQGRTANELFRLNNLKEELEKQKDGIMPKEMYNAIYEQEDLDLVRKSLVKLARDGRRDNEGRNALHILFNFMETRDLDNSAKFFAAMYDMILFINEFNPAIHEQSDKNGDTPLHYFARLKPSVSVQLLRCFQISRRPPSSSSFIKQNLKGNTATHEAVLANNHHTVLEYLVEANEEATSLVNENNETLLHLLAAHPMADISDDVLHIIIRNNIGGDDDHPLLDKDGLTPVMRAFRAGNTEFAARLLVSSHPSLASMKNFKGQTFWHMLVYEPPIKSLDLRKFSLTKEAALNQLEQTDEDGKTALHLAVEKRRFDLVEAFLGLHENRTDNKGSAPPIFLKKLLDIPNDKGKTPADQIGELAYIPPEIPL